MHHCNQLFKFITISILFVIFPMTIHAESIFLHEILDRLGLQPTILELDQIKKGGSMTAAIQNPEELSALGFKKLKQFSHIHLENLGDQYWMITYPSSRQKAKIRFSRQNNPAKKPWIRIKLIYLVQG
jgi:hypothetical protein